MFQPEKPASAAFSFEFRSRPNPKRNLRKNEVRLLLACYHITKEVLKAICFNGLKLVACGSIERRYLKEVCGLY